MTTKIRRGVFETNSSSSHSITIGVGDFIADKMPLSYATDTPVCVVYPGEYGWEVETYFDAATKASYALTYAKMVEEHNPVEAARLLDMLTQVLRAETDVAVEFKANDGDIGGYPWGYIDHQSGPGEGGACGEAFESAEQLRAFIFNPASVLRTDNDNH